MFIISANFHVCHTDTPGTTKRSFPFRRFFHPSVPSASVEKDGRHGMAKMLADMGKTVALQCFIDCPDGSKPSVGTCKNLWQTWDVAEIGRDDFGSDGPNGSKNTVGHPSGCCRHPSGSFRRAFQKQRYAVKHQ